MTPTFVHWVRFEFGFGGCEPWFYEDGVAPLYRLIGSDLNGTSLFPFTALRWPA